MTDVILPPRPLGTQNAVDTIAELRALDSDEASENTNVLVADVGFYKFDPDSLAADASPETIRPDDKTSLQAGRWILLSLASAATTSFTPEYPTELPAPTVQNRLREFKLTSDYCACNGVDDDTEAFDDFWERVSDGGGGMIWVPPNGILRLTSIAERSPNVRLNLNGARMLLELSANGPGLYNPGFRPGSGCGVYDGTVEMDSAGGVGSQGGEHAVFTMGPMYGEGGTSASPSPLHDTQDWFLRNLVIISNAVGKPAIQLMGGVRNWEIDHITVASNSVMSGIVQMDWSSVGNIDTSGGGDVDLTYAAIVATRARFDAGTAWTTHPHAGTIRRIYGGDLSYADSFCLRFSSCYGIEFDQIECGGSTNAAITWTGGDVCAEFMLAAEVPKAMKNLIGSGVLAPNCRNGYGFRGDTDADNVRVAMTHSPAYVPRFPTQRESNAVLRDSTFGAAAGASVVDGATLSYATGMRLVGNVFTGFRHGIDIANGCRGVIAEANTTSGNRQNGHNVDGVSVNPEGCLIVRANSFGNGISVASRANINIAASKRTKVYDCQHGNVGAADTADFGIRFTADALNVEIVGNHCRSTKASTGVALTAAGSTNYNVARLISNNSWDATYTAIVYTGVDAIPVLRVPSADGRIITTYRMASSVTPTGLTLAVGDTIEYSNPAAGGFKGLVCTTAGNVGGAAVTKTFGAISA